MFCHHNRARKPSQWKHWRKAEQVASWERKLESTRHLRQNPGALRDRTPGLQRVPEPIRMEPAGGVSATRGGMGHRQCDDHSVGPKRPVGMCLDSKKISASVGMCLESVSTCAALLQLPLCACRVAMPWYWIGSWTLRWKGHFFWASDDEHAHIEAQQVLRYENNPPGIELA